MSHELRQVKDQEPLSDELADTQLGRVVLGGELVQISEDGTTVAHTGHGHPEANGEDAGLAKQLRGVRRQIRNLSDQEKQILDDYLDEASPPFARARKHDKAKLTTWSTWLADETLATDKRLMRFLSWHAELVAEQTNDPDVQEKIDMAKAAYQQKLHEWYDRGWIASDEVFDKAARLKVHIGDVFDTLVTSRLGYHIPGTDNVVIRQGIGSTPEERKANLISPKSFDTIFHEFNHSVFRGFGRIEWMNEAVAEEAAVLMRREIMYGTEYQDMDTESRVSERQLLRHILNSGSEPVLFSDVMRAFSSRDVREVLQLHKLVDESWGVPNVFASVNARVMEETRRFLEIHKGMSEDAAREAAVVEVTRQLHETPEEIFGKGYTHPSNRGQAK